MLMLILTSGMAWHEREEEGMIAVMYGRMRHLKEDQRFLHILSTHSWSRKKN